MNIDEMPMRDRFGCKIGSSDYLQDLLSSYLKYLEMPSEKIATLTGMKASALRRLLSAPEINPKFEALLSITDALGSDIYFKSRELKWPNRRRIYKTVISSDS